MSVTEWLKSGQYLPPVLRDFHDQKDVFKAIHEAITKHPVIDGSEAYTPVNWISGHMYVIDVFLWFMARCGYTLQRSRARLEFADLAETVQACKERRNANFIEVMKDRGDKNPASKPTEGGAVLNKNQEDA